MEALIYMSAFVVLYFHFGNLANLFWLWSHNDILAIFSILGALLATIAILNFLKKRFSLQEVANLTIGLWALLLGLICLETAITASFYLTRGIFFFGGGILSLAGIAVITAVCSRTPLKAKLRYFLVSFFFPLFGFVCFHFSSLSEPESFSLQHLFFNIGLFSLWATGVIGSVWVLNIIYDKKEERKKQAQTFGTEKER